MLDTDRVTIFQGDDGIYRVTINGRTTFQRDQQWRKVEYIEGSTVHAVISPNLSDILDILVIAHQDMVGML